jgi:hypothetical protein
MSSFFGIKVTTTLHNYVGGWEVKFHHHVEWKVTNGNIDEISHYKTTSNNSWVWRFSNIEADFKHNYGSRATSVLSGKFKECLIWKGCVNSRILGSSVTVYPDGDYYYSKIA